MHTDIFIDQNFQPALEIHEECDRLGLSADTARLLTYIHIKLSHASKEGNLDFQNEKQHKETAEVIDFMMDKRMVDISENNSICYAEILRIPRKIATIDAALRNDHGMEIRIASELNNRYRFHKDPGFRKEMMKLYLEKIKPAIQIRENID